MIVSGSAWRRSRPAQSEGRRLRLPRWTVFGTSLALARLEAGTMTVFCWRILAAFKMALLALCTDAAGMIVALIVVLLASLRLMTCEPAVLTADTGRKAVATGLIVICLVISIEGPPAVATTVVGGLVGDEKIAVVVVSPFFRPSRSNSGRTRVTMRLICPDEVLIVLILTFGMTGVVSMLEEGEPLLLPSLGDTRGAVLWSC